MASEREWLFESRRPEVEQERLVFVNAASTGALRLARKGSGWWLELVQAHGPYSSMKVTEAEARRLGEAFHD